MSLPELSAGQYKDQMQDDASVPDLQSFCKGERLQVRGVRRRDLKVPRQSRDSEDGFVFGDGIAGSHFVSAVEESISKIISYTL